MGVVTLLVELIKEQQVATANLKGNWHNTENWRPTTVIRLQSRKPSLSEPGLNHGTFKAIHQCRRPLRYHGDLDQNDADGELATTY
jgi:hypothetical protein